MLEPVFSITSDQRYYCMLIIAMKDKNSSSFETDFKDWIFVKKGPVHNAYISHFVYNTNKAYHRGDQEIYNTEKNINYEQVNSKALKKFLYDCILINIRENGLVCILAPFAEILDEFRSHLLQYFKIDEKYVALNILNIIKRIIDEELVTTDLTLKTTGLGISKSSSGDISNIIIKGNKPLSTDVGELVFNFLSKKEESEETIWFPSNFRIKCITGRSEGISRINLSLNADKYGNYKLYLQKACINIISLLSFLKFVLSGDYFYTTSVSPTQRNIEHD